MRRIIVAFCISLIAGAGMAQAPARRSAERAFYVILDISTKKCAVVDKEPKTDSASITVATDAIYRTRAEAEAALTTLKPCMR